MGGKKNKKRKREGRRWVRGGTRRDRMGLSQKIFFMSLFLFFFIFCTFLKLRLTANVFFGSGPLNTTAFCGGERVRKRGGGVTGLGVRRSYLIAPAG